MNETTGTPPDALTAREAEHMRADLIRTRRALQHCREEHRRRSALGHREAQITRLYTEARKHIERQAALNLDRALRAEALAATMAQRALAAELELDRIKREGRPGE